MVETVTVSSVIVVVIYSILETGTRFFGKKFGTGSRSGLYLISYCSLHSMLHNCSGLPSYRHQCQIICISCKWVNDIIKWWVYISARLNTTTIELRHAIEALMRLLSDACRHKVYNSLYWLIFCVQTSIELIRTTLENKLSINRSALIDAVCECVDRIRPMLEITLDHMIPRHLCEYKSVDWRFDVQVYKLIFIHHHIWSAVSKIFISF